MADKPVSIHPQGIVYTKNAEGKYYKNLHVLFVYL